MLNNRWHPFEGLVRLKGLELAIFIGTKSRRSKRARSHELVRLDLSLWPLWRWLRLLVHAALGAHELTTVNLKFIKGSMEQKFSVVLYVWQKDSVAWVKQALDSVFSSTVQPAEMVIMVDGPVNEDMQAVIEDTAKNEMVRVLSHPVPLLRAAALAFAINQCQYDLIAIQGADSISLPSRFEKQLSYFAEHPETSILGGYAQEMSRDNEALPTAIREVPETEQEIKSSLKAHSPFIYRTVMFKKQAILEAGNYKAFPHLEDEYLWVRVIGKGYKAANLKDILANIHSIDAHKQRVLALPLFQMKRELFSIMRQMGMIGSFTYYRLVCTAFIKYLILPNWFRRMFHLYEVQA